MRQEKSLKNAVFMIAIAKYSNVIITLIFNAVLARLLTPEDYGIVAVITVFTTFFSTLSDVGFGTAVIQNKELEQEDINNIYTFTVYLGLMLGIAFAIASYPISLFYQNNEYIWIGCVLSISVAFGAFNMVPNAIIMRKKYFSLLAMRNISATIAKGAITIIMAVLGAKYYALVFSAVFYSVLIFVWNKHSIEVHFTYKVLRKSIKKIWTYSISQFAFNIVNYFSRNLDNLLTGKYIGSEMLGYYDKAYQLMVYPTSGLTNVITPALHPIFSDYQNDKKYLYEQYIKIVRLLAIAGFFCTAICFSASKEIILILYGNSWRMAIPCFTFLSISIWSQVVTSSSGAIFQSVGDTKRMFYVGSFNAGINIIACLCGISLRNINLLAMCIGACYCTHFFTTFFVLIKLSLKMPFGKFLFSLWREFLCGLMLAAAIVFKPFYIENPFFSLLQKTAYLGAIYLLGIILSKEYKFIWSCFHKK